MSRLFLTSLALMLLTLPLAEALAASPHHPNQRGINLPNGYNASHRSLRYSKSRSRSKPVKQGLSRKPKARPDGFFQSHVLPALPTSISAQSNETCLRLAIYHEARGESPAGQRAVASVILQRAATPGRWGGTVCKVVSPVMFSFVSSDLSTPKINDREAWARAGSLATEMMRVGPLDTLQGANHFHSVGAHPAWRLKMKRTAAIGRHVFYAD